MLSPPSKRPNFPLAEFLHIGFTHHVTILNCTKDLDERLFYKGRRAQVNKRNMSMDEKTTNPFPYVPYPIRVPIESESTQGACTPCTTSHYQTVTN